MKQSVAEILSLRFQYEEIVRNFDIPENKRNGHINSLEWLKNMVTVRTDFVMDIKKL